MCIAFPGKIISVSGKTAVIQYPHETREVLVSDLRAKVGDWALVQMGIVVKILSEEEAKSSQQAWKEVLS
mgnify:CR=1 FL=1